MVRQVEQLRSVRGQRNHAVAREISDYVRDESDAVAIEVRVGLVEDIKRGIAAEHTVSDA